MYYEAKMSRLIFIFCAKCTNPHQNQAGSGSGLWRPPTHSARLTNFALLILDSVSLALTMKLSDCPSLLEAKRFVICSTRRVIFSKAFVFSSVGHALKRDKIVQK